MILGRSLKHLKAPTYTQRNAPFIDREFQLKYMSIVLTAALIGILSTIFPVVYFLNDNYRIFVQLSYEQAPALLDYLERERMWLTIVLSSGCLGTMAFFWYLSFKLTNRIIGPMNVLKNHLRNLSRGRWGQPSVVVRKKDEFHDLIETYNYFYNSFRVNLKRDLELLTKLSIDPKNRDAHLAWKELIKEKVTQLEMSEEEAKEFTFLLSSASPAAPNDQRHAS